ncbi:MAG TPA: 16S rRNA (adenine(1518)-N(6)/adenine(1519)-N(6))-dimethyltransferase RsmA, partial [Desulfobacterales bacterium]|nr:16S rRNA (adenine(1518)-N(6)/adenine(1519)-N(6))-dimethyltransferase RsmA [Desulfobacterales bacterium]
SAHDLRPRKQLGQNFLAQPATARMIVDRARIGAGDRVLEIGPGLGALTLPLAEAAGSVLAIEKDAGLVPVLRRALAAAGHEQAEVREADILGCDLAAIAREAGGPLTVVGNLPYNISSQVVVQLIEARRDVARAVLMFQRELAARLVAAPGGRDYGRITAMLSYCASVQRLAVVGASAFYPAPQVSSEVVAIRFEPDRPYPPHDERHLFRVIAAAFGQRRKTLRNALASGGLGLATDAAEEALRRADIDPRRRAETLPPEEFVRLEIAVRSLR